jgi:two-component system cell cycle sensor histidine kinase/response regulator CckA
MDDHPLHVLVVDDDAEHAAMVVEVLRLTDTCRGATIDSAHAYDPAVRMLSARPYDIAFVDYRLGARDGLTLLREIRANGIETPVVVLTGHGAEEVAVDAMKAGAADYLSKTQLSVETLDRTVRHALALHAHQQQRRQAEAAVRASEERFRALVENSSDALLLIDPEGRVQYVTPSSQRYLGYTSDDMVGRSIFDFLHPDDRDIVAARMADTLGTPGRSVTAEVRFQHADGNVRIMEGVAVNRLDDPSVGAIVVNARDVTERRRLEDQLRQAHKMEAVGQLAGGVAHDFNNLLTAILGYSNLLLDDVPEDHPMRRDLEEIRAAGERASSVTRQLLAFSRRQMLQPQIVDINALIRQLEKLLRGLVSAQIEVMPRLAPDLAPVKVDPGTIEQVLVNLCVNAKDAMPHGGSLTIETANVNLSAAESDAIGPMPPGRYVVLAIGDTGEGMDEATSARIFEPFFTTREQGRGSGLGLATVYGMVKQSGGYIWVRSEPGRGTTFKIYLPPAESVMLQRSANRRGDLEKKQGWETVLLVEDEDAVRSLARAVLRRHGYTVLEARHGVDALRLAERHRDDIHLLLTDMVMPHMNGPELAKRLASVRPKMKVLFMSGYVDRSAVPDLAAVSFLPKPFTPETLARKVRLILDRAAEIGNVAGHPEV